MLPFREEAPSDGQPKDQNAKPDVEYTRLIEITEVCVLHLRVPSLSHIFFLFSSADVC